MIIKAQIEKDMEHKLTPIKANREQEIRKKQIRNKSINNKLSYTNHTPERPRNQTSSNRERERIQ